jgi:PST family polysaccharide transporter
MSLAVFTVGAFAVPNSQLMRDFKQNKIFLANAIGFVFSTVLLITLAKTGGGAMAFAWSMVVRQFVMGGVLVAVAPRRYRPGFARSALSVILKFGVPLAGANFVNYILLNVDYAFVGHLLGAAKLGVYMLAFTVASWPYGLLGAVINNVSMPAFSRVKHDPDLLKNAMASALRGVALIVLPICGMSIALARPIVLTVYGAKWVAAANVLVILSVYGAVFVPCLLFTSMITAFGRTKFLLVLQLVWIGTLVPAMALGVHKDGIVGAAYAHVAVILPIVLPSYLIVLRRVTGVRLAALGKAVLPALLASSAAALAAHGVASQFGTPLVQVIAGLVAGGVIYVICAGQQAVAVFAPKPFADRVLRLYGPVAGLLRLPRNGLPRPAAGYANGEPPEKLKEFNSMHASGRADLGRQLAVCRPADMAPHASLAYAYPYLGWRAETVALHERTLAEQERLLGPNHPHTLASRANLAYAYCQTGWLEKAIPLYEQSLAGWKRSLGPDHPRTLRSSNYLAATYREAGRLTEAVPLYERALAGRRRVLGDDHPSTLRSSYYLASCYHEKGQLAEAICLYEEIIARCARVLGDDHTMTRKVRHQLGAARELIAGLSLPGSFEQAEQAEQADRRRDAEPADGRWRDEPSGSRGRDAEPADSRRQRL